LASVVETQIPSAHSNLNGISATKEEIQNEILKLLKSKSHTPTELQLHFHHKDRSRFSRDYLYPLRDSGKIIKVDGSNHFQLPKQKNTTRSIRESLLSESEIFKTESFQTWIQNSGAKNISTKHTRFARICLGLVNPKFKIHPDNITKENWKEIIKNMIPVILQVAEYEIVNGEPNFSTRQAIRGFIQDGLNINISKKEGENLKISGTKPKPKVADLHITPEQIEQAKILLKKRNVDPVWFLKFGVKTWTFVRPSTTYLIELDNMEFLDQVVEYVEGEDGVKITKPEVIQYAKFKGDKVYSYTRRICHIEVKEHKTDSDFHKYILDYDFVEALEKFYNTRVSQRKKYLFWEDNKTEFTFENYDTIVKKEVGKDNNFFKIILSQIGFQKSDFGIYFRANYGFRHFGLQMWLLATDYDYELVSEMSHEDTATLKKWYGKRTRKDFENKIRGIGV